MGMVALTEPEEIAEAFARLKECLAKNAEACERVLGWPGNAGSENLELHWHVEPGVWAFAGEAEAGYFWCAFGAEDPQNFTSAAPALEISIDKEGTGLTRAGRFVRDESSGWIFLGHSGRIGGGTRGVGAAAFQEFYGRDELTQVRWPSGRKTGFFLLGALDDDDLPARIAAFLGQVDAFRKSVRGDKASIK